jgi:hypothetical protein
MNVGDVCRSEDGRPARYLGLNACLIRTGLRRLDLDVVKLGSSSTGRPGMLPDRTEAQAAHEAAPGSGLASALGCPCRPKTGQTYPPVLAGCPLHGGAFVEGPGGL